MLSKHTLDRLKIVLPKAAICNEISNRLISSTPADSAAAQVVLAGLDPSDSMKARVQADVKEAMGSHADDMVRKLNDMIDVLQALAVPAVKAGKTIQHIVFAAVAAGATGNDIRVVILNQALNMPLIIAVSDRTISITVATDGAGPVSQVAFVVGQLQANSDVTALVDVSIDPTFDNYVILPTAIQELSGGVSAKDGGVTPAKALMGSEHMSDVTYRALKIALGDKVAADEFKTAYNAMVDAVQAIS